MAFPRAGKARVASTSSQVCTHLDRVRACSAVVMRFEGWGDALCSVFELGHRFGFDPVRERWAIYSSSCSGSAITRAYELPFFPVYLLFNTPLNFTSFSCNSNTKQPLNYSIMMSTMDQSFPWAHPSSFPLSIQTQSLTSNALYSPASQQPRSGTSISSMSSLASFGSGNYGFGNDSPVLGGLGMARGSHAQWSSVGSETNSTKSPLERLGFKLNLTGEKRTRGLSISLHHERVD